MRRALTLVILVAALAGLWWKREDATRLAIKTLPFTAAYLTPAATAPGAATTGTAQTGAAPPANRGPAAVPVNVAKVVVKQVPLTIDAVGTVQPLASIPLRPRIDSQIVAVNVEEGALVKQGDLLVRLDNRSVTAQLAQADATLLKSRSQLEQLRRDLARADDLLSKRITSEVQRDTAATAVKVQQAQIAADQAQRDNLATLLTYTEIRAPVSGRIGSIALKAGTAVRSGDSQAITTVNQIDPIHVAFAVPQSIFGELRAAAAAGSVRVEARTATGTVVGSLAFVENTVDLATGTVLARAIFSNGEEKLWPGSFVAVKATLGIDGAAVAVPSSAVQLGQRGPYVFVVKEGRRAEIVPVTVTRVSGDDTVIAAGLAGGEDVVVNGQLRLVDGARVQVQSIPTAGGGGAAGDGARSAADAVTSPKRS